MISESAQPIYIYPDQLITETWPIWVETILSKCPPAEFHNSKGFQQLVGSENANARTRAFEAYRIGLLLHRIISERTGGANVLPLGWEYVCENKSVLSKAGYLAYAVGKALSKESNNTDIRTALNVLYLIFSLSIGTKTTTAISTVLIYRRVLQCFRSEIGDAAFDAKYEDYARWLAGAVFNTLDNPTSRDRLVDEYINSDQITSLILQRESDKKTFSLMPHTLAKKLSGNSENIPEINQITRHKAALFWAAPQRGIYTNAALVGTDLIDCLIPLDRDSLAISGHSILDSALQVEGAEEHLLLEKLNEILTKHIATSTKWGTLMNNLSKGVYAALTYLDDSVEQVMKPVRFHLHGVPEISVEPEDGLTVSVKKDGVPVKPDIGAIVVIGKKEYKVLAIDENETSFSVTLEVVKNSV